MVVDDDIDVKSGSPAVRGSRSLQATDDFEAGFRATGATLKKAVVNSEGHVTMDLPETRYVGLTGKVVSPESCATSGRRCIKIMRNCMLPALQKKLLVENVC